MTEARLARLTVTAWETWGLKPRFNVAPSQPIAAVCDAHGRRVSKMLHWGLVPPWAKDVTIAYRMINARSETAHEKPAFKHAFRRRRCLIPTDGFYEWPKTRAESEGDTPGRVKKSKRPYLITMADEQPFCMAGLWEHWQDAEGNELESCAILTTQANELVGELHDRMPVILEPEQYDDWLDHGDDDSVRARRLCVPYPDELMMHRPVSTYVNSPKNEGPACIKAHDTTSAEGLDPGQDTQGSLF